MTTPSTTPFGGHPVDRRRSGRRDVDQEFGMTRIRGALTGPYALSLRLFPVIAAITFLPAVAVEARSIRTMSDAVAWMGIELAGFIALGLFYLMAKYLLRLSGMPLRHPLTLFLISGAGGGVQGLVIAYLLTLVAIDDLVGPTERIASGFIVTLFWLPVEAVVLCARAWVRDLRVRTDQEQHSLERTRLAQSQLAHITRRSVEAALAEEVRLTVDGARVRFEDAVLQVQPSAAIQALLRDVAASEIRPLATELWGQAESVDSPKPKRDDAGSWLTLLGAQSDRKPFYPAIATLMVATLVSPILIRNTSFLAAAPRLVPLLGLFYLIQRIGSYLIIRAPRFKSLTVAVTLALSTLLPILIGLAAQGIQEAQQRPTLGLVPLIFFGLTALAVQGVIAIASASLVSREAAYRLLREQVDVQRVQSDFMNAEIARESRRWATYLHGQVQSRFLAAASLLENSARSGDPDEVAAALTMAGHILGDISITPVATRSSLREELDYRAELWSGLVRIDLVLGEQDSLPASVSLTALGEAAEEGISNAVRHGHARQVTVAYAPRPAGGFRLEVSDDGLGIAPGSASGMGSALLSEVSGGDWSLTRDEQLRRTVLSINLV